MTGVDTDLATLRPPLEADATPIGRDWVEYAKALEAELSRLREERAEVGREAISYKSDLFAEISRREAAETRCAQLEAEALAFDNVRAAYDDLIEERDAARAELDDVRDEYMADAGLRTAAEARCARLQQALAGLESAVRILDVMLREPAAEGLMSAEDYRAYLQGAWLGVDEAADKARALLSAIPSDGGGAK